MLSGAARGLLTAALLAAAASPAVARKDYEKPTSAEDFKKILTALAAEAEAYAQRPGDAAPTPGKLLEDVMYVPESAGQLDKALQATHKDPLAQLHVAWQLLQPLHMAGNDLLRKLRPTLTKLLDQCTYKTMPTWPTRMLLELKPPPRQLGRDEARRRAKARTAHQAKKHATEYALVKHNRMANALEKTIKSLLVLMADEKADEALLERLGREVDLDWITFEYTLEAVRDQAVHMKKDRAKLYYDRLLAQARKVPRKKAYADPTRALYSETENSTFHTEQKWFALDDLKVVNLLATSAREPAVILPKEPGKRPRRGKRPKPRR